MLVHMAAIPVFSPAVQSSRYRSSLWLRGNSPRQVIPRMYRRISSSSKHFHSQYTSGNVDDNAKDLETHAVIPSDSPFSGSKEFTATGLNFAHPPRILFACGGTGGHVFPAIAIAEAIKLQRPEAQIVFVGTKDRMEWSAVPAAGFQIFPIPAVGLKRPLFSLQNLLLPFKLLLSLISCIRLVRSIKPHVVVGTGGYVSAPTCVAAFLCGCPVVLQEQNAIPGLANRLLGFLATYIFIAFDSAKKHFPAKKCILSGNPVREALCRHLSSEAERLQAKDTLWQWANSQNATFPNKTSQDVISISRTSQDVTSISSTSQNAVTQKRLASAADSTAERAIGVPASVTPTVNSTAGNPESLLILGGSLGAAALNRAMVSVVQQLLALRPLLRVVWQTGNRYREAVEEAAVARDPRVCTLPFIDHMDVAYAGADVAVARAGAVTCSELLVTRTPSLLVPSPNVAEDHQTANARAMAECGAAMMVKEGSGMETELLNLLSQLLGDSQHRKGMEEKCAQHATPFAALNIAQHILVLANVFFGNEKAE